MQWEYMTIVGAGKSMTDASGELNNAFRRVRDGGWEMIDHQIFDVEHVFRIIVFLRRPYGQADIVDAYNQGVVS